MLLLSLCWTYSTVYQETQHQNLNSSFMHHMTTCFIINYMHTSKFMEVLQHPLDPCFLRHCYPCDYCTITHIVVMQAYTMKFNYEGINTPIIDIHMHRHKKQL